LPLSVDFSYRENFCSDVFSSARSLWKNSVRWLEKPVTD
jgi:hypothetical protein